MAKYRVIFREIFDYSAVVEANSTLEARELAEIVVYSDNDKPDPSTLFSGDGEVRMYELDENGKNPLLKSMGID